MVYCTTSKPVSPRVGDYLPYVGICILPGGGTGRGELCRILGRDGHVCEGESIHLRWVAFRLSEILRAVAYEKLRWLGVRRHTIPVTMSSTGRVDLDKLTMLLFGQHLSLVSINGNQNTRVTRDGWSVEQRCRPLYLEVAKTSTSAGDYVPYTGLLCTCIGLGLTGATLA